MIRWTRPLAAALAACATAAHAQVSRPRTVALTGRPLVEVGGSSITMLGRPVVGSTGAIYFTGEYTAPGDGFKKVMLYAPPRVGDTLIFRREGDPVPELGPAVIWAGFGQPAAHTGQVMFTGGYGGGGISGTGLWQSNTTVLNLVATNQMGSIAPGTTGTFGQFLWVSFAGSSFGSYAIRASVSGAATASSGIWVQSWIHPMQDLRLMALEGDVPPDLSMDVQYDEMGVLPLYDPVINTSGVAAFLAPLRGNVTSANNRAIIVGTVDGARTMARTGSPAPGMPAGAVFATLDRPWSNASFTVFTGRVVGGGVTPNDDEAIWQVSWPSTTLEMVVREGIAAPGIGGGILLHERTSGQASFRNPIITGSNTIYFLSGLLGTGINNDNDGVVYRATRPPVGPWAITLIAREGQQAPGLTPGVDRYGPFANLWANSRGEMALTSQIQGTSTLALYAGPVGYLRAAAVANRSIDVGTPGAPDLRTINFFFTQYGPSISSGGGGGGGDGLPTCISEAGTLVFRAELTGGAGIFELLVRGADINGDGSISVQDIFEFLQRYFENHPDGDFNATGGNTPDDIFDFLARYFSQTAGG